MLRVAASKDAALFSSITSAVFSLMKKKTLLFSDLSLILVCSLCIFSEICSLFDEEFYNTYNITLSKCEIYVIFYMNTENIQIPIQNFGVDY